MEERKKRRKEEKEDLSKRKILNFD